MRKLSWFFVFAFMAYACQLQNADESVLSPEGLKSGAVQAPEVCGEIMSFDLFAGNVPQDVVGRVDVSNNDDYLFVEIYANADETFTESHLNISCTMPDKKGSPGGYNANDFLDNINSTSTYKRYVVPKSFIDDLNCTNDCFYLLVHAATGKGETAFGGGCGEGNGYVDANPWFNYICYCWQECCKASGKVEKQLCAGTPIAVEGATVYLFNKGAAEPFTSVLTGVDGSYIFNNIPFSEYEIRVGNDVGGAVADPAYRAGTCGGLTENLNFKYYYYSITGDVDEFVCDIEEQEPGPFTVTLRVGSTVKATVQSNAAGNFTFSWLPAGMYTVSVAGATPVDVTLPGVAPAICVEGVQLNIYLYDVMGTLLVQDCEDPAVAVEPTMVYLFTGTTLVASDETDMYGKYEFTDLIADGPYTISFEYKGKPYEGIDVASCDENSYTVVIPCKPCYEYFGETAWANGLRYVARGNWATYTPYVGNSNVILYAGQTMPAGNVHFSNNVGGYVTITITLNEGWTLDEMQGIHIQGYTTAPTKNPAPGQFTTYTGTELTKTVPYYPFYGVHVNVLQMREVPCVE